MKFEAQEIIRVASEVAPFTGAWIEIRGSLPLSMASRVAPFTGAWIEIVSISHLDIETMVAPFTGAWIEIAGCRQRPGIRIGRSLYGSVD